MSGQSRELQSALYWNNVARSSTKGYAPTTRRTPSNSVQHQASAAPRQAVASSYTGVSLDATALDRILASWDKLLETFPDKKRALLESLGGQLLEDVRQKIGGKTGKDSVQDWQERYVGSKNGYVAVRPKADTYKVTAGGKKYAVGHVTNAIENGHKHRRPSQTRRPGYRYKARINVPAVAGKHFYAQTRSQLNSLAKSQVAALAGEIVRGLEGGAE